MIPLGFPSCLVRRGLIRRGLEALWWFLTCFMVPEEQSNVSCAPMAGMLGSSDACGDGGRGAAPSSAACSALRGCATAANSGARPSRSALRTTAAVILLSGAVDAASQRLRQVLQAHAHIPLHTRPLANERFKSWRGLRVGVGCRVVAEVVQMK